MRGAITTLFLVGLFCCFPVGSIAGARNRGPEGLDIPHNAEIAGIRVYYNTLGQLEHRLWPGSTFKRDRPDRASVWEVKSTGWIVKANDGDYEHTGQNLYGYGIEMPDYAQATPAAGRVCYVALPPRFLRFNKRITLGMSKSQVMAILHSMHIRTSGENDVSWSWGATWEASFQFRRGRLVAMGLYYS